VLTEMRRRAVACWAGRETRFQVALDFAAFVQASPLPLNADKEKEKSVQSPNSLSKRGEWIPTGIEQCQMIRYLSITHYFMFDI